MRNFTLFILTVFLSLPAWGQRQCGTEIAVQEQIRENPSLQVLRDKIEARNRSKITTLKTTRAEAKATATYNTVTIPVVVHIVLQNPNAVTDAQVQSQIDVLNKDYAALNTDTSILPAVWKALIGNAKIQFCLAQRTPSGEVTNGIERVTTTKSSFSISSAAKAVKFTSTGGAAQWDGDSYLNIWVTHLESGYLGVATFPGLYADDQQGVVIDYTGFGTTGTAASPYNKGRTATHEIGHYFNLRHIWGDEDACAADDGIDDTPKQAKATYGCPAWPQVDQCASSNPGYMFENYMDYSDDACLVLFTTEQVDVIRTTLTDDRASLLSSNGCTPLDLKTLDAQVENVISPYNQQCDASITPSVLLKNMGLTTLTKVNINYQTDEGTVYTTAWTGSLAALKSDTVSLPTSSLDVGEHVLKAWTSLPNGSADDDTGNDTAWSTLSYYNNITFPLKEGFESSTFPPAGWEISNPDGSYTWERTSVSRGDSSYYAIVVRNYAYQVNDEADDIRTPTIDPGGVDSIFLFFDVAAASYTNITDNSNTYWDRLLVMTTSDCSLTYDTLYNKWDSTLVTVKTPVTSEFVPTAAQWRRDSVNLTPIMKKGQFRVVFRNIANNENNIYLDNINIVTKSTLPYLKEKGITVGPVPTSGALYVTFLEKPDNLDYIGLYNTSGQMIASQRGSNIDGSNRFTFDLVNEPNGVYFVKLIYRNTKAKTYKIIKVN